MSKLNQREMIKNSFSEFVFIVVLPHGIETSGGLVRAVLSEFSFVMWLFNLIVT